MPDPAVISSAVATLIVVALALARLVYRLGQFGGQLVSMALCHDPAQLLRCQRVLGEEGLQVAVRDL